MLPSARIWKYHWLHLSQTNKPKTSMPGVRETPTYSLTHIVGYFLRLGTLGFGGPVALVGFMHLVEDRKLPPWLRITSDKLSLM
jgi:hypothetical protein